jgi:hypothetical protein
MFSASVPFILREDNEMVIVIILSFEGKSAFFEFVQHDGAQGHMCSQHTKESGFLLPIPPSQTIPVIGFIVSVP